MGFNVKMIGGYNLFQWEKMQCPVCKGKDFTSLSHSSIWCDECNAEFTVSYTTGDPGCVIGCSLELVTAPACICEECRERGSFFGDTPPMCPNDEAHGVMTPQRNLCRSWLKYGTQKGLPERYILVTKNGECSGWSPYSEKVCGNMSRSEYQQWEKNNKVVFATNAEFVVFLEKNASDKE